MKKNKFSICRVIIFMFGIVFATVIEKGEIKMDSSIPDIDKIFTDAEADRLLESLNRKAEESKRECKNWHYVMWAMLIELALKTGLRVAELRDLKASELRFDNGRSYLKVANGKGSKQRYVPIIPELKEKLLCYMERFHVQPQDNLFNKRGKPFTRKGLQYAFKASLDLSGIDSENFSFHSCRHYFALKVYKTTKDIRLVQILLGHSKVETTMIYLNIDLETMGQDLEDTFQ
jgi:site-specific recombinase XerD